MIVIRGLDILLFGARVDKQMRGCVRCLLAILHHELWGI
jgi:hypothetical protein